MSIRSKIVFIVLLLIAPWCRAACTHDEQCVSPQSWQFGVALGLGFGSNPLKDGDTIPLFILPDIAWYGEAVYFDNGELGYQWTEHAHSAFVTFLEVDQERAYFSFWHPVNILNPINKNSNLTALDGGLSTGPEKLSIDHIATRDWAILAGTRWHYYTQDAQWQISVWQDVTGTHNGQKMSVYYQHSWNWQTLRLVAELDVVWKSSKLLNYYYGIRPLDKVDPFFYYQAKGGWQPALTLSIQKPLNDKWLWLTKLSVQKLNKGMTQSPLVEDSSIYRFFSGFAYQF
ncbi:MipA/OmpV family protein [Paraglaciecola sp.]|uniref:MipA/OmpV family protein n=1 Tax=Paraglaciecola sp. TaxID=1920173 RepID=UPI00273D21C2|nr:MipA/OmpV family protein [Paraglaciecola sp.]MDP5032032.1 MipA/OmpV family protein [Paraglaciecola sp.]